MLAPNTIAAPEANGNIGKLTRGMSCKKLDERGGSLVIPERSRLELRVIAFELDERYLRREYAPSCFRRTDQRCLQGPKLAASPLLIQKLVRPDPWSERDQDREYV